MYAAMRELNSPYTRSKALGKAVKRQKSATPNTASSHLQNDPVERLQKLKQMLEEGLITQDEFDTKKAEILSNI